MADYTKQNLRDDVDDMGPQFGYGGDMQARFARKPLELANSGVSYFKLAPGFRVPFGHTHSEQEEVYVVLTGSARVKAGDEVVELAELDAIRLPAGVAHGMEGGPDGAEMLALGAPNTDNKDVEMLQDFWPPEEDS